LHFAVEVVAMPSAESMIDVEDAATAARGGTQRWSVAAIEALFALPFTALLHRAQAVHREHHAPDAVQLSTLLSIKTGGCPEDCGYCPQAKRHHTGVADEALLDIGAVTAAARAAKAQGATRFCMGAAWRGPKERDLAPVLDMVREVKALGLETCATLGMLKDGQAERLRAAGLDYYNHNLDAAPEFYGEIVTTRDYQDRLDTLQRVRGAGINVCCGGIVGMGESRRQRAGLIGQLANLDPYPESVPINHLVQVEGTPLHGRLEGENALDPLEFVRTIAVARITMPKAMVRLSAGRRELGDAVQALCFLAGANSVFYGDHLLTTGNPDVDADRALFARLGLRTGA
jgi:biotin synthase